MPNISRTGNFFDLFCIKICFVSWSEIVDWIYWIYKIAEKIWSRKKILASKEVEMRPNLNRRQFHYYCLAIEIWANSITLSHGQKISDIRTCLLDVILSAESKNMVRFFGSRKDFSVEPYIDNDPIVHLGITKWLFNSRIYDDRCVSERNLVRWIRIWGCFAKKNWR